MDSPESVLSASAPTSENAVDGSPAAVVSSMSVSARSVTVPLPDW